MTDLSTASFNAIVAELRKRYPVILVAVQFYPEGKPTQIVTRLCHGSHAGDPSVKLGLAHTLVLHLEREVLAAGRLVSDDLGLDDAPPVRPA